MAYETAITIKKAIENIKKQHYILPSIQREFVWGTEQIETLFDSLMRDYPIGTFLFWKVDKERIKDFQFYGFLKKYHEKDHRHNQKVDLSNDEDIIALLDGQQRMTSLYLALEGSYADKKLHARKNSTNAYPERKLYLNLLKPLEEAEKKYDFRFLTKEEAERPANGVYWFNCHEILEFESIGSVLTFLIDNNLTDTSKYTEQQPKFALSTLSKFWSIIHETRTISAYLEESEELDKVLQIFIRINSGGTKLSYSDLLLSIATAQWSEKDARDVIHKFVDDINEIGDGFSFNKDIVLKNSLVLADLDVKFKVDNFNKENMKKIEQDWDRASSSLSAAIELIASFGYNAKNLIATNAIIPISYFIYKNECEDKILTSSEREIDRKNIKEWLARVLLKSTFGGTPDSIYPNMRDLVNDNFGHFPLEEIISDYRGKTKSISFSGDEIENLLDLKYGQPKTYCALTLIYPALNHSFKYHQDHIHPKSKFENKSMKAAGFSDEQIRKFNDEANGIANLQLLESTHNIEKTDTPFKEWLKETKEDSERYLEQHHINPAQSLEFEDFLEFIAARKETIKGKLKLALGVSIPPIA